MLFLTILAFCSAVLFTIYRIGQEFESKKVSRKSWLAYAGEFVLYSFRTCPEFSEIIGWKTISQKTGSCISYWRSYFIHWNGMRSQHSPVRLGKWNCYHCRHCGCSGEVGCEKWVISSVWWKHSAVGLFFFLGGELVIFVSVLSLSFIYIFPLFIALKKALGLAYLLVHGDNCVFTCCTNSLYSWWEFPILSHCC